MPAASTQTFGTGLSLSSACTSLSNALNTSSPSTSLPNGKYLPSSFFLAASRDALASLVNEGSTAFGPHKHMKNCDVDEFLDDPDAMLRVPYACVKCGGLG